MLTEKQLELRKSGIGASEIASIMAVDGAFSTPLEVYLDKLGLGKSRSNIPEAIYWGTQLEEPIAKRYAELHNITLLPTDTLRHKQYPFILATPDKLIAGQEVGVEIKTVGPYAMSKWEESIPLPYLLQCHQGMLVTGYKTWILVALMGGQELKEFKIEYDADIAHMIINACCDFWLHHVDPKIPPPVDYKNENALELIKRKFNQVTDSHITIPSDIEAVIRRYEDAKTIISKQLKIVDSAQAQILDFMQNNAYGQMSDGRIVKRTLVKMPAREQSAYEYVKLTIGKNKNEKISQKAISD